MIFHIFDAAERCIGVVSNVFGDGHTIFSAVHDEGAHTLSMTIDAGDEKAPLFANGHLIGFYDADGLYQMFEIKEVDVTAATGSTLEVYAEHVVYELAGEPVYDIRPTNATVGAALTQALSGTRWSLGRTVDAGTNSARGYYTDALSVVKTIAERWGVELSYSVEIVRNQVNARRVNAVARLGADRGRRFEYAKDTQTVQGYLSLAEVKTALVGRGKGVETGTTDDGDATYGRRLKFSAVAWSKAAGDPADKPLGAEYVEDVEARRLYGLAGGTRNRVGFVVFDQITDPAELLRVTWDRLQELNKPVASYKLAVTDLEATEGEHEAVRMGDVVRVLHRAVNPPIAVSARVTGIKRDLLSPEATTIELGDARSMLSDTIIETGKIADKVQSINGNGTLPTDHLQGVIDAVNNQLLSTMSNWHTDPIDGSVIFETPDGTKAMRLSGAGWQIAASKVGGVWQWRTAATGTGIVADEITTGTLNANLVKLLGSGTSLDGTTLTIKHPSINATAETTLGLDGLKMILNGTVIGGMYKNADGTVTSAAGTVYNPQKNADFRADVGGKSSQFGSVVGLEMKISGASKGTVGIFSRGNVVRGIGTIGSGIVSIQAANDSGVDRFANIELDANSGSAEIVATNELRLRSYGSIVFEYVDSMFGTTQTYTLEQIIDMIPKG